MASTDIGRLTPSGATVNGSTTAPRIGTTGRSDGKRRVCGVSGIVTSAAGKRVAEGHES